MKIIVDDSTIGAEVLRSIKERWFSWPWRPWVKMKHDPNGGGPLIEDGAAVDLGNGTLVMNSRSKREFEAMRVHEAMSPKSLFEMG